MLYRFRKAMRSSDDANFVASAGRSPNPSGTASPASCGSIPAALRARRELRKSLSRQIMRIQDASLEPDAIRRLNDQINEALRTVRAWDECLLRLGHRMEREEGADGALYGSEAVNAHGYWYFGRARELPGVRELLQEQEHGQGQQGRDDKDAKPPPPLDLRIRRMMEKADDEYFGKTAEGTAVEEEAAVEGRLRDGSHLDWITGLPLLLPPTSSVEGEGLRGDTVDVDAAAMDAATGNPITIVPTQEQVGAYLIERRREELLRKYAQGKGEGSQA